MSMTDTEYKAMFNFLYENRKELSKLNNDIIDDDLSAMFDAIVPNKLNEGKGDRTRFNAYKKQIETLTASITTIKNELKEKSIEKKKEMKKLKELSQTGGKREIISKVNAINDINTIIYGKGAKPLNAKEWVAQRVKNKAKQTQKSQKNAQREQERNARQNSNESLEMTYFEKDNLGMILEYAEILLKCANLNTINEESTRAIELYMILEGDEENAKENEQNTENGLLGRISDIEEKIADVQDKIGELDLVGNSAKKWLKGAGMKTLKGLGIGLGAIAVGVILKKVMGGGI